METDLYKSEVLNFFEPMEDIVHDMKIPLTIMYTQIQSLEDSGASEEIINSIKRNWFRVMKLLNDLSDYKKIQKEQLKITYKNLDLIKVFDDLIIAFKTLANKKNISINYKTNMDEKIMAIDKGILDRIILNIVSNAIKYSASDSIIYIEVKSIDKMINIVVRNTGNHPKTISTDTILDRYIKSVNVLEFDKSKNTMSKGIGLNIAKEFVSLLNGQISFENKNNETIVSIKLPSFLTHEVEEVIMLDDFYVYNMIDIELSDDYNIKF